MILPNDDSKDAKVPDGPVPYKDIRALIETGDVVGVKAHGLFGWLVQKVTKEGFSHVALFVWLADGLWVFEFVEGTGFQCMPASQWFQQRKKQRLFWGKAPEIVLRNDETVKMSALSYRDTDKKYKQHYGYISLIRVAIAQALNTNFPTLFKVCSTYVQCCWEKAGHIFHQTADPGDIMRISRHERKLVEITG